MQRREMREEREDAVYGLLESRIVVLDITSRLRRSEGVPSIRARRESVLGTRALWEMRRISQAQRQLKRQIAIRRAQLGARRAALRAARRRELMAWACCAEDELALALEAATDADRSPAGGASKAGVGSATIVKTFPIHRIVRSDPGYSLGASYSGDDSYSLDAS